MDKLLNNGATVKIILPNPYFGRRAKVLSYEGSGLYRVNIEIGDSHISKKIHRDELELIK